MMRSHEEEDATDITVVNMDRQPNHDDSLYFPETGSVKVFSTCRAKHAPFWMHLRYIHSGYRVGFSWRLCLASVFRIHNETGNVWTHLLGAVVFFIMFCRLFYGVVPQIPNDMPWEDILVMCMFYLAGGACLLLSSVYHAGRCYSEPVYWKLYKCDLLGIKLSILGSYLTGIHFAFYCYPSARRAYTAFLTICAVGLGVVNWHPRYAGEKYHNLRALLFVLCVGSSVVPTMQWLSFSTRYEVELVIPRLLLMFACYGMGLLCYVYRFPENLFPGKFDIWGHSHQWWHVFITMAMIVWEADLIDMMVYRMLTPCLEQAN